jgi:hypothetical protein
MSDQIDKLLADKAKAHLRLMNAKVAVNYSVPSTRDAAESELKAADAAYKRIIAEIEKASA